VTTLADAVAARLRDDPAAAAALPGGVYTRDLKREGPGATPGAYATAPPHVPVPAAVVVDDGEQPALTGPPFAQAGVVSVWFYATRSGSGRDAIAAAVEATRRALVSWSWTTANGPPARFADPGQRLGVRDDPVDAQRLVDRVSLPYAAVWRLA
jgi:hypothetical protein